MYQKLNETDTFEVEDHYPPAENQTQHPSEKKTLI